jgi:hypothetical protein
MLRCLEPSKADRPLDPELVRRLQQGAGGARIRCPSCRWQHDGREHWACEACGDVFDTFVTGASCPSCPQSWTFTQCPKCDALSPHEDWYERQAPEA